jgi:gliding motility-associated-like protein
LSSTDPTTCGGTDGTIALSGLNPLETYVITYGGIDISSIPFNAAGDIIITGLGQGAYTNFIVQDANCVTCFTSDNTILTLVDPTPPNVDAGADQSVCDGTLVTLSGSGATTYSWNNSVTDGSPFIQNVGTVTYTVTGFDANGCSATDQVIVVINSIPGTPVGTPVSYCVNDLANPLNAIPAAGVGSETFSLNWYGTTASGSSTSVATIPNTTSPGTYIYYVSQTNVLTGCEGPQSTISVIINALTLTVFNPINSMCEGTLAPALPIVSENTTPFTGSWTPSFINTAIAGTVTYTFVPDANQCASNQTLVVTVNPSPNLIITNPDAVCFPENINLTSQNVTLGSSNVGLLTYWTSLSPMTAMTTPTVVSGSGTFYIQAISGFGCLSAIEPVYVVINSLPIASFVPSSALLSSFYTECEMINSSENAVSYVWDFGDSTETSTETSPMHTFPYDMYGNYNVQLIAISEFGCVDTTYQSVKVKEELAYYIPNSFTPNNDGFNDVFLPVFTSGFDPNHYSLLIFNRWGQIVFESHDSNASWDGNNLSGQAVEDGTYTWKIEFKAKISPQRKIITGHVNVLR